MTIQTAASWEATPQLINNSAPEGTTTSGVVKYFTVPVPNPMQYNYYRVKLYVHRIGSSPAAWSVGYSDWADINNLNPCSPQIVKTEDFAN